jgi:hypothetical protein
MTRPTALFSPRLQRARKLSIPMPTQATKRTLADHQYSPCLVTSGKTKMRTSSKTWTHRILPILSTMLPTTTTTMMRSCRARCSQLKSSPLKANLRAWSKTRTPRESHRWASLGKVRPFIHSRARCIGVVCPHESKQGPLAPCHGVGCTWPRISWNQNDAVLTARLPHLLTRISRCEDDSKLPQRYVSKPVR